jgi:hypothetical protein
MLARLEIELVDPEQDGAADDQRETHDPRIEQHELDVLAGKEADDDGRQEGDEHADDETAGIGVAREHADRDIPQLPEIESDDRKDRAELNQNSEAVPERPLAEAEEPLRKQEMAGRGDGKELRHALDDAEDHCPYRV